MNACTKKAPGTKAEWSAKKPPLELREIWALRVRLEIANHHRDLALLNLAIDSKLRSCDLVKLKVRDVAQAANILKRAMVIQQKTLQPVKCEITQQTRESLTTWIESRKLTSEDYLFPSRIHHRAHLSTRQYARIVKSWVAVVACNLRITAPTHCVEPKQP